MKEVQCWLKRPERTELSISCIQTENRVIQRQARRKLGQFSHCPGHRVDPNNGNSNPDVPEYATLKATQNNWQAIIIPLRCAATVPCPDGRRLHTSPNAAKQLGISHQRNSLRVTNSCPFSTRTLQRTYSLEGTRHYCQATHPAGLLVRCLSLKSRMLDGIARPGLASAADSKQHTFEKDRQQQETSASTY